MSRFIGTVILVYRTFRHGTFGARLHTLIRFLTAPLLRVADRVPSNARLLDIGSGHGLFGVLAQIRGARVVCVEPDMRKVFSAATHRMSVIGYDTAIRGTFDTISIIDVLYKIPVEQWDPLFERVKERLRSGGTLLIKEMDPTEKLKNRWNALQERLVSMIGLTLGESFNYETPSDFIARLKRHGFTEVSAERIDRFYPHPHLLYVAVKS